MSITYPLTMPVYPGFRRWKLTAAYLVGQTESPYTAQAQRFCWQADHWVAEIELPPMKRPAAELWLAMLVGLRGRWGSVLFGDPAAEFPRGIATGTPQVDGAGQTGTTLNTKGWTASIKGILLAGDYLQLGSGLTARLYKNLKDADSDASGKVSLDIFPRLRESPADSDSIKTSKTVGLFRLGENTVTWDLDAAIHYGIAFTLQEAI